MARRLPQIAFGATELLYRRVERGQVTRRGEVRPTALRLQVSVARAAYGTSASAILNAPARFNGVAAIEAGVARSVRAGDVRAVCVDEPLDDNPAHSLIALVTDAEPTTPMDDDINAARVALAANMRVVIVPY